MKWISACVVGVLLMCSNGLNAQPQGTVPFHIWKHKLTVPLDSVKRFGVMENSLLMRYEDDSTLAISIVNIDALPTQSQKTASEILAAVYGEKPPQDEELKVAHANNLKDALEHQVYTAGPLSIYFYRYPEKEIAYVADPQEDRQFLTVESKGRNLRETLDSLTRR